MGLITLDGKLLTVLGSLATSLDCCCNAAPCSCSDDNNAIPTLTAHIGSYTVTLANRMDGGHPCQWSIDNVNTIDHNAIWGCAPGYATGLACYLTTSSCSWGMQFFNGMGGQDLFEKFVGDTPAGTYARNFSFPRCGYLPDTITVSI